MPTSEHAGYVRGEDNLRALDFVDAGLVRDCLINNVNHLFDQAHPCIVSMCTQAGSTDYLRPTTPVVDEFVLVARWGFRVIAGPRTRAVYRIRVLRSGGSGAVGWLFNVRPVNRDVRTPVDPAASAATHYHSTSATTPTALTKSTGIDVSSDVLASWTPVIAPDGARYYEAYFEAWARIAAVGAVPCIVSANVRLFQEPV